MMWQFQLEAMSDEELYDLIGYLHGYEKYADASREQMIRILLTGKKRSVFYLIDKEAYKTLRRLVRHPDRPLTYRYYPVEQLLAISMIEPIENQENDAEHGWYQIRREAMPFALKVAKNRHYDPLVAQLHKQDELLLGMLHTYGLLELNQCVQMLKEYGIEIERDRLFASITWRLSIREPLQAFQVSQHDDVISFIMLRGMDFIGLYRGIMRYPMIPYVLCDQATMQNRKDRYYASEYPEMKQLRERLMPHFSRRFINSVLCEMIDTYQYHVASFTNENTLYRVIDRETLEPYVKRATEAIPDVYRKGLAPCERV